MRIVFLVETYLSLAFSLVCEDLFDVSETFEIGREQVDCIKLVRNVLDVDCVLEVLVLLRVLLLSLIMEIFSVLVVVIVPSLHHLTIIVGRKSEIEGKHRDTGQGFGFIS
jgi:hypothetical protein